MDKKSWKWVVVAASAVGAVVCSVGLLIAKKDKIEGLIEAKKSEVSK